MKCAVASCNKNTLLNEKNLSFFSFPKNARLAKKWELFCGNPKQINPKNSIICSEHFLPDEIAEDNLGTISRRRLKAGAIPCLDKTDPKVKTRKKESKNAEEIPNKKRRESILDEDDVNCTMLDKKVIVKMDFKESPNVMTSIKAFCDGKETSESNDIEMDDFLDMECYQAVIDELTNQNESLRLENLRLKVSLQLQQKKCKQSKKELEKTSFQLQQIENIMSTMCTKDRLKKILLNIEKLWSLKISANDNSP